MAVTPQSITQLLLHWSKGDEAAFEQLIPLVYPELRRLARRYMGREDANHTLQTSALINEAYLRLIDQQQVVWKDRGHFFAVATRVMRHILIDHARRHRYAKRGGGAPHVPLDSVRLGSDQRARELLALDEALQKLSTFDARKSQIVEMRFFGGMTVEETAEVLGISAITVKREWRSAKAWLHSELTGKALS